MKDPKDTWLKHDARLKEYQTYLNQKRYCELHFVSELINLTVGLVEGHVWNGNSEKTVSGEVFISNMPVVDMLP